jgi:threonine/homoserine/homoserine lactone efflux protein
MNSYWLFVGFSAVAIATPGPGVLLTVSNALRYGFARSFPGVLGLAIGMLGVGVVSAAGLGALLMSSAAAFTVAKYVGAVYLIYLGLTRLLAKNSPVAAPENDAGVSHLRRFTEGVYVTVSNPKAFLLYASLFPQFVDPAGSYVSQLALLAMTFSGLMVAIHSIYCVVASAAKRRVLSERSSSALNRATGGAFIGLGVGVVAITKQ